MIYNKIKVDLTNALKLKNKIKISVLRVLIFDIQRKSDKNYDDDYIISVINKTLKFLKESCTDQSEADIETDILMGYLPVQISEQDIISYLKNIDFDKINPMAAIGKVIKHFPNGSVNGRQVKNIIANYIN